MHDFEAYGEAAIDYWAASRFSPLYDYRKYKWPEEMCQKPGIDPDKLPNIYSFRGGEDSDMGSRS